MGTGDSAARILTSAPDGGERPASLSGCTTPQERTGGTRWTGDRVGPRFGTDSVVGKRRVPAGN